MPILPQYKFEEIQIASVVVHPRQLEIADGIVKLPLYMSFCL